MADPDQLLQPCPHCATLIDVSDEEPFAQVHCPICGGAMRVRRQFNSYQLEEVLGAGGMGAVYRAVDLNLARPVALKLLRKEFSADEEYIGKFENEAKITASINHPHVVKVFSYGSDHGLFYIAMELVDKGSLDDLINLQKRVAEAQVLEVGVQTAEGLRAAWLKGLIHRDVKPGNILFAGPHTAKIVDFGLALLMAHEAEARGEVWGTPYYVAPEKLNKEPEDFRSDIYSLGGTLFHALAGRPPFEAETASLVALKHIKSQAVSLQAFAPHVSGATAFVINRMLNKDPEQRYQSYDELIEHLNYARQQLLDRVGAAKTKKQTVVVGAKQEKVMAWLTLVALLLLVVGGAGTWFFRDTIFKRDGDAANHGVVETDADDSGAHYKEAKRLLLAGSYEDAANAFQALAVDPEVKPMLQHWSAFHRGLALLLNNQLAESTEVYADLRKAVEKWKGGSEEGKEESETIDFFRNSAAVLASPNPPPADLARAYKANSLEGFALLVFGLKDWQLGDFDSSLRFLQAFEGAKFEGTNLWLAEYQPLSHSYVEDLKLYAKVKAQAAKARTPEEKARAAAAIKEARGKLKVGGKLNDEMIRMEVLVQRKAAEQIEESEKSRARFAAEDDRKMDAFERTFAALIRQGRLEEAAKGLGALVPGTDDTRERKSVLQKKLVWLQTFETQLQQDLRSGRYTAPLVRKDGVVLPGRIIGATADHVHVRSDYGDVDVSWTQVSPAEVMKIATFFAQKDQANAPSRYWLLGVYAVSVDHTREGHRLILEAAQKEPRYTDDLTAFFGTAGEP